ncbi:hypothetical protein D9M68_856710 [compost metagenome]
MRLLIKAFSLGSRPAVARESSCSTIANSMLASMCRSSSWRRSSKRTVNWLSFSCPPPSKNWRRSSRSQVALRASEWSTSCSTRSGSMAASSCGRFVSRPGSVTRDRCASTSSIIESETDRAASRPCWREGRNFPVSLATPERISFWVFIRVQGP